MTPAPNLEVYYDDFQTTSLAVALEEQSFLYGFRVEMNGLYLNHKIALVEQAKFGEDEQENAFKDGKPNAIPKHVIDRYAKKMEANELECIDFNYVYYFDAHFLPGTNVVKLTYEYSASSTTEECIYFPYELTPACRWANGQIDDFTLVVDMGDFANFSIPGTFYNKDDQWTIHGEGNHELADFDFYGSEYYRNFRILDGYVEFKKKNFRPQGELDIIFRNYGDVQYFIYADKDVLDVDEDGYWDDTITLEDACILKNLPFAYRGYVFKSEYLQAFFNTCSWYKPDPSYVPTTESLTNGERRWVNYWANYKPKVHNTGIF